MGFEQLHERGLSCVKFKNAIFLHICNLFMFSDAVHMKVFEILHYDNSCGPSHQFYDHEPFSRPQESLEEEEKKEDSLTLR